MARVTVEDCVKLVPNRFDLVVFVAHRARQIASGAPLTIDKEHHKRVVLALKEVAIGSISSVVLYESMIKSYQKNLPKEVFEDSFDYDVGSDTYLPTA